jgi:hypothetical protein
MTRGAIRAELAQIRAAMPRIESTGFEIPLDIVGQPPMTRGAIRAELDSVTSLNPGAAPFGFGGRPRDPAGFGNRREFIGPLNPIFVRVARGALC